MSNDAMNNQLKYEEALAQLETIVRKMEANEFDIDELAVQLKTAQRLIKFCKDKLTKTEDELRKIQSEAE
jgi:exodeoxyribonuclease VII small subunit